MAGSLAKRCRMGSRMLRGVGSTLGAWRRTACVAVVVSAAVLATAALEAGTSGAAPSARGPRRADPGELQQRHRLGHRREHPGRPRRRRPVLRRRHRPGPRRPPEHRRRRRVPGVRPRGHRRDPGRPRAATAAIRPCPTDSSPSRTARRLQRGGRCRRVAPASEPFAGGRSRSSSEPPPTRSPRRSPTAAPVDIPGVLTIGRDRSPPDSGVVRRRLPRGHRPHRDQRHHHRRGVVTSTACAGRPSTAPAPSTSRSAPSRSASMTGPLGMPAARRRPDRRPRAAQRRPAARSASSSGRRPSTSTRHVERHHRRPSTPLAIAVVPAPCATACSGRSSAASSPSARRCSTPSSRWTAATPPTSRSSTSSSTPPAPAASLGIELGGVRATTAEIKLFERPRQAAARCPPLAPLRRLAAPRAGTAGTPGIAGHARDAGSAAAADPRRPGDAPATRSTTPSTPSARRRARRRHGLVGAGGLLAAARSPPKATGARCGEPNARSPWRPDQTMARHHPVPRPTRPAPTSASGSASSAATARWRCSPCCSC